MSIKFLATNSRSHLPYLIHIRYLCYIERAGSKTGIHVVLHVALIEYKLLILLSFTTSDLLPEPPIERSIVPRNNELHNNLTYVTVLSKLLSI